LGAPLPPRGARPLFETTQPGLPTAAAHELQRDRAKLHNMVQCAAEYVAMLLTVEDEEGCSLCRCLREEIHDVLSDRAARPQDWHNIEEAYIFAKRVECMAHQLSRECARAPSANVNLAQYAQQTPYNTLVRVATGGSELKCFTVGGAGRDLYCEVQVRARDWLKALDRLLCSATGIERTDVCTQGLTDVVDCLSDAIAQRITCGGIKAVSGDGLSSRTLETMIMREAHLARSASIELLQAEVRGLQLFRCVASDVHGDEARRVLDEQLHVVVQIAQSPPQELQDTPQYPLLKLPQLLLALAFDADATTRRVLVAHWASAQGSAAVAAIDAALRKMEAWRPSDACTFCTLIRDAGKTASAASCLPSPGFVHAARVAFTADASRKRRGLDERGLRSVRLIQCVWELCARGVFAAGMVAAEIAELVAMQHKIIGGMAAATLSNRLKVCKGRDLSCMISTLCDMEGDVKWDVRRAMCVFSRFSCAELATVFSTSGTMFKHLSRELWAETRSRMTVRVLLQYKSFAADALGLLLPLLHKHRSRVGVVYPTHASAVIDLLFTVPKAAQRSGTKGKLRLFLDDLKGAHPDMRRALDKWHAAGSQLVTRRGGGCASKRQIVYEFDVLRLRTLSPMLFIGWPTE